MELLSCINIINDIPIHIALNTNVINEMMKLENINEEIKTILKNTI